MNTRTKQAIAAATLALGGFGAGAAVAVTGAASAATDTGSSDNQQPPQYWDPSKSTRPDEHLLTGTTASKVRAAALAKYPGATIQRVETDSNGVYEAHIVTKDGGPLTVLVGKDFTVTGTDDFGGHGGFGRHGDGDGDHGRLDGGPQDVPPGSPPSNPPGNRGSGT